MLAGSRPIAKERTNSVLAPRKHDRQSWRSPGSRSGRSGYTYRLSGGAAGGLAQIRA